MDVALDKNYESFFEDFLKNSKKFLSLEKLSVVSNIQSKMLFDNSSQVIYGSDKSHLPEYLNGLGYMNILYLLLQIEIKKENFKNQNKDINLLFIEEPEAHTHPQMQYIFANEINSVLRAIVNLQTLITSHSSHIVSQSDFEDIRYLKIANNDNVEIRNFHTELKEKYSTEPEQFKFLKQYLNIQSAELFFASKVIFIEGITERMLLPYFIQKFDEKNSIGKKDYISLASQNISILEVGANAKVFAPFLEFLDIKTLVITDIDTTAQIKGDAAQGTKTKYETCPVFTSTHTSNATLKYYLNAPTDILSVEFDEWFGKLRNHSLDSVHENIHVAYQKEESGYHARSFEDAFINSNKEEIKSNKDVLMGLKNREELDDNVDMYDLTNKVLDKKSDFAASLLYQALSNDKIQWETPLYIKDGLLWLWELDR
jgi:predicted ATP-dependent endonuclease of OLD family